VVFKKRSLSALLTGAIALVGCETTEPKPTLKVAKPFSSLKMNKEVSPPVAYAFQLLKEGKYKEASQFLNQTLQSQPKNPMLHILNGLTYEKLAERGDASGLELACIGYQNAINLDPANIFALTQLAKIHYQEKRYDEAQEGFANALLVTPNDVDLLHEFAAASYYAYDIKTALSAIDKAEKLNPDDPLVQRSAAMIHAALGDFKAAKKHLAVFQNKMGNDPAVNQLVTRLNDWQYLYKSGRIKLAAATSQASDNSSPPESASPVDTGAADLPSEIGAGSVSAGGDAGDSGAGGGVAEGAGAGDGGAGAQGAGGGAEGAEGPAGGASEPMGEERSSHDYGPQIVVDCYLLRITEDAITSKGNNILQNLAITLTPGGYTMFSGHMNGTGVTPDTKGNTFSTQPSTGFNNTTGAPILQTGSTFTPSSPQINLNNQGSLSGSVFTSGITWAGLTYSLNIANATDNRTEVVSRPSLMTFLGKQSVFFSGDELVIGLSGQFGGTLTKYPVGVTLLVTPQTLEGDVLTLNIAIEGSLLTTANPNLNQTVRVGKTRVDTFAKVRLGETLMLGGIYEKISVDSTSGVPGLQDVPIVQYFFSNESTHSARRSIVFMLTPRSPDAVKAAVNRAMSRETYKASRVTELKSRNPNWFATQPNLISIFHYIEKDPVIYYEFRTGDILPPSWGREVPVEHKLVQLEAFLYY
jgi:Tfp pilus assembly protein PilF